MRATILTTTLLLGLVCFPNISHAVYCCCYGTEIACYGPTVVYCPNTNGECTAGPGNGQGGNSGPDSGNGGGPWDGNGTVPGNDGEPWIPGDDNGDGSCDFCESCQNDQNPNQCQPVRVTVFADEDNNNGYEVPIEANNACYRNDNVGPGKLVAAFNGDFDQDSIPDFADGLTQVPYLRDLTHDRMTAQERFKLNELADRFVPIVVTLSGNGDPNAAIAILYNGRIISGWPDVEQQFAYSFRVDYTDNAEFPFTFRNDFGPFRVWANKPSAENPRDGRMFGVEPEEDEGELIYPNTPIPVRRFFGGRLNGSRTLWVESVWSYPELTAPNLVSSISASVVSSTERCDRDRRFHTAAVLPVEINAIDLHHYHPQWNPAGGSFGAGSLQLDREPFTDDGTRYSHLPESVFPRAPNVVGGAITDGASAVIIEAWPRNIVGDMDIRIDRRNDSRDLGSRVGNLPEIFGGLFDFGQIYDYNLPPLPLPRSAEHQNRFYRQLKLKDGAAMYVPPNNFLSGPLNHQRSRVNEAVLRGYQDPYLTLNIEDEIAFMDFNLIDTDRQRPQVVAQWNFILRRPPVLLVHGIRTNPSSWHPNIWSETTRGDAEIDFSTRIYKANWAQTNAKGYPENYGVVGKYINPIVDQYRSGGVLQPLLDHGNPHIHHQDSLLRGTRFAITRVDAIGHSQGGQLIRTYISDIENVPMVPRRSVATGFTPISIMRGTNRSRMNSGEQIYFRSDNLGAGDIRRFVPIGSVFRGSPIATFSAKQLDPSSVLVKTATKRYANDPTGGAEFCRLVNEYLPPGPFFMGAGRVQFDAPTSVADLAEGSPMQRLLEQANYPEGNPDTLNKSIPWFPIVGIARPQSNEDISALAFLTDLIEGLPRYATPAYFAPISGYGLRFATSAVERYVPHPGAGDMVVDGFSQRNANEPSIVDDVPEEDLIWRNPYARGLGLNAGLGVDLFYRVHSDSGLASDKVVQKMRAIAQRQNFGRMEMEQEARNVAEWASLFLRAADNLEEVENFQINLSERFAATFSVRPESLTGGPR